MQHLLEEVVVGRECGGGRAGKAVGGQMDKGDGVWWGGWIVCAWVFGGR